ncbi:MAG: sodium/proton-translocating pyrophosphatase, partial [Gammaproteobacteria bacterium]|nr:sodium/proton-translocating pyrophosphatase [Gammaproteobacteria bacterium]
MPGITITVTTVLSLLGLGIAFFFMKRVTSVPLDLGLEEKDATRLRFIHGAIADGAMAFLKQEYKVLTIFMLAFAVIIALLINDTHTPDIHEGIYTALAFLFGAAISIASGYIGMKVATQGNARTTVSAKKDISHAFDVAINSGAVMGFALVGLATLGLVLIYVVMRWLLADLGQENNHILMEVIAGFGLGGSTIALFARVGGGIFTKAADVGADLVGKV